MMQTLRPNDFYLGEDAPCTVEHSSVLKIAMPFSGDAVISAFVRPPINWDGSPAAVTVIYSNGSVGESETTAANNIRIESFPHVPGDGNSSQGSPSTISAITGPSGPAFIPATGTVSAPEGYTEGDDVLLVIEQNATLTTDTFSQRIVAVIIDFTN